MRRATKQQRLRHRLIQNWRGVEGDPLIDNAALPVSDLLPALLKEWKLDEKMRLDEAASVWRAVVGNDFIARQTAPDTLKRGVLTVRVLQPAVHHTLSQQKAALLKKIQQHFGDAVKDIRFRHG